jgi:hypothetical protein
MSISGTFDGHAVEQMLDRLIDWHRSQNQVSSRPLR